jgi:NitT/TauT family transport system permease protein
MVFGALGGSGGMGWFIFQRRVFMDTPGIFAGLLVVLLLGLLVEGVFFGKLEKSRLARGRLV